MCNNYEHRISFTDYLDGLQLVGLPLLKPGRERAPNLMELPQVRPNDEAPILRQHGAGAELLPMRWGFRGKADKAPLVINMRSEGRAFEQGRCLVPVSSFVEYTGSKYPKTRWRFRMPDVSWFCFAGLWRQAEEGCRYSLLTVEAGPDIATIHGRQPAILRHDEWSAWLTGAPLRLTPSPPGSLTVEREN